ncbi:hypothetical protein BU23DRAFT_658484, partial [Bimuria novae-zelandiae CBS 107.79]
IETPSSTLLHIRRYYKEHNAVSDGEKYLRIRFFEREKNREKERMWRGLLSKNKAKYLNRILRNPWLCEALDELEPFRSLWADFQLGSFPHILSWRCSQIQHYLFQMQKMWHEMTDGNGAACDESTIAKLQGLAPRWSVRDRSVIEDLFSTNKVFVRVRDPDLRARILARVLAVEGIILSFQTFFKHARKLGPVMLRLRDLFPASELFPPRAPSDPLPRPLPSVRDVLLQKCYKPSRTNRCLLQYSEFDERYIELRNSALYSYWQLCLYLLRQQSLEYPPCAVRLGHLARRLGFETDEILELSQQDADTSAIRSHLHREKPKALFWAAPDKLEEEVLSRRKGQDIFEPRQPLAAPPMTAGDIVRDGALHECAGLFLPAIWSALGQEANYTLTSYGTLILILASFFGGFRPWSEHGERADERAQAEEVSPSSSVYSLPNVDPQQPSTADSITFWRLPESRNMAPVAKYRCNATLKDIKAVINKISLEGVALSFAFIHTDGRLKLCHPLNILNRRKQSKWPNNVYYLFGDENRQTWLLKKLNFPTIASKKA